MNQICSLRSLVMKPFALLMIAMVLCGCGSGDSSSQPTANLNSSPEEPAKAKSPAIHAESPSLRKAKDGNLYWADRIEAASELKDEERAMLHEYLTCIVRKVDFDVGMMEAVIVLGEVGDAETVRVLEEIRKRPIEIPGRVNATIRLTTQEIRKRLGMSYIKFRPLEPSPSASDLKPTHGL